MNGDPKLYSILTELDIVFEYHEHPPAPTIEEAMKLIKSGKMSPSGQEILTEYLKMVGR